MERRMVIATIVLTVILSGMGGIAGSQESPGSQMMGPGMMGSGHGMRGSPRTSAERPLITFMLEQKQELGLTSDQVRALEAIRSDFQRDGGQRIMELEAAEQELDELLTQTPLDLAKVEATLRKIEGMRVAFRLDRIKAINQGKALLSPEQREQLQALLEQVGRSSGRPRG